MQDRSRFDPANELELILSVGLERRLTARKLDATLLGSEMHVMVDRQMPPGVWEALASPLIVDREASFSVIPAFTSPKRFEGFPGWYPAFPFSQLVSFRWLLASVKGGLGLAINPGWPVGIEMDPEQVERIRQVARAA